MMSKRERIFTYRQKKINQKFIFAAVANIIIIMLIMLIVLMFEVSGNNKNEGESKSIVYESIMVDHNVVTLPANASNKTDINFCRNISEKDKYLLAKIAMAEAEGESLETKVLIIFTILNRVESSQFPDTVEEVIFEKNEDVYQFSPVMPNGRWWEVEPDKECWTAVEIVNMSKEDVSENALYFEACSGESWHSRNLELICQSDNTRFYK